MKTFTVRTGSYERIVTPPQPTPPAVISSMIILQVGGCGSVRIDYSSIDPDLQKSSIRILNPISLLNICSLKKYCLQLDKWKKIEFNINIYTSFYFVVNTK